MRGRSLARGCRREDALVSGVGIESTRTLSQNVGVVT